jgi:hypothetical protein
MKNLTLNQMVTTAIALKRYELRHGRLPQTLATLVPDLLPTLPIDYMDGQPLRYRSSSDGSFLLYSVGDDGLDGGGDSGLANGAVSGHALDPWRGSDWAWPRVAASKGKAAGT